MECRRDGCTSIYILPIRKDGSLGGRTCIHLGRLVHREIVADRAHILPHREPSRGADVAG